MDKTNDCLSPPRIIEHKIDHDMLVELQPLAWNKHMNIASRKLFIFADNSALCFIIFHTLTAIPAY